MARCFSCVWRGCHFWTHMRRTSPYRLVFRSRTFLLSLPLFPSFSSNSFIFYTFLSNKRKKGVYVGGGEIKGLRSKHEAVRVYTAQWGAKAGPPLRTRKILGH